MKKVCVVSGGTSGLGLQAVRQLLATGQYRVMLASRNTQRGQAVVQQLVNDFPSEDIACAPCDLESLPSVKAFADAVKQRYAHLDLLVCNAGVLKYKPVKTADGFESVFQTNHLSHFLLCHLLMPRILASARPRVVIVSSELHRRRTPPPSPAAHFAALLDDQAGYQGFQVYSLTKLFNIMHAYELAKRFAGKLTCVAVTPGFVPATGLSRDSSWLARTLGQWLLPWLPFAMSVQEGSRRIALACTDEQAPAESQTVYYSGGVPVASNDATFDAAARKVLWDESCQLLGIDPKRYGAPEEQ